MEDMYFPRAQSFRKEVPSNHYAELACSKRVHMFVVEEDEVDLFDVPVPTTNHASCQYHYGERKKGSKGEEKHLHSKKQKQGGGRRPVSYVSTSRPPKAVDEDLYKIPPEFLYQIPKRKRMLGNFWTGCLGLSCIA